MCPLEVVEKEGGFLLVEISFVASQILFMKYIYVCFIHCPFGCCANVLSLLNGKDFSHSLLVMWALGKKVIHREYLNNVSTWMWQLMFACIAQKSVSFEYEHALCWSLSSCWYLRDFLPICCWCALHGAVCWICCCMWHSSLALVLWASHQETSDHGPVYALTG